MKKAFTLVEILVVVTIISLLASIAAISYSRFVKQSRDARRKTDIEQIRAAIELYRNFNGAYPTPGMVFGTDEIVDGATTYMSKVPNDPMSASPSANRYYYYTSPTGVPGPPPAPDYQDYSLCAYIEGGDTTSISAVCGASSLACNYCMGPYGQK